MTSPDRPDDVIALRDGLAEQKGLYLDMETVAARQKGVLASGDEEALERLMDEKRAILEKVGTVEARIADAKRRWKDLRERIGAEDRARIEQLMDEVGAVLQRLMALETEGHAMLQERQRQTGDQLRALWKTRQLPKSYGPPAAGPSEPRFLDRNQ